MGEIHTESRVSIPRTWQELKKDEFCYFIKSQHWERLGSWTARCGNGYEPKLTHKISLSVEESKESTSELGADLDLISAKVIEKYGSTITRSIEETQEIPFPIKSEKCTKVTIPYFQKISQWYIEPYIHKRRKFYSWKKEDIPRRPIS